MNNYITDLKNTNRVLRKKSLLTLKRVNKLILLGNYSLAQELTVRAESFHAEMEQNKERIKYLTDKAA